MSVQDIYVAALEHPTKSAVVYNGTAISYGAFADAIAATSRYLEAQDLPAGETVVVVVYNLLDCWVTVLALQAVGLNTVCVASIPILETLGLNHVAGIVTTELAIPKHQLQPDPRTGNRIIAVPNPSFSSAERSADHALKGNTKIGGHILYASGTTVGLACAGMRDYRPATTVVRIFLAERDDTCIFDSRYGASVTQHTA